MCSLLTPAYMEKATSTDASWWRPGFRSPLATGPQAVSPVPDRSLLVNVADIQRRHFGDFAFKFPAFGAPVHVKHELVSARTELQRGNGLGRAKFACDLNLIAR